MGIHPQLNLMNQNRLNQLQEQQLEQYANLVKQANLINADEAYLLR